LQNITFSVEVGIFHWSSQLSHVIPLQRNYASEHTGVEIMKASDIMTKTVITIRGAATVADAIAVMNSQGWRALIVDRRNEEDAYGIITETDIVGKVIAYGRNPKLIRVHEIMTKPCIVVNPDLEVEYVARLFADRGLRIAPVIEGELLGVISMTDILAEASLMEKPKAELLDEKIQTAIEQAQIVCAQGDVEPRDCITAWSIVEDLQVEAAYQRSQRLGKTALEEFLEQNPDWQTPQEVAAWCSG
jgi:CBS domain-containing protein